MFPWETYINIYNKILHIATKYHERNEWVYRERFLLPLIKIFKDMLRSYLKSLLCLYLFFFLYFHPRMRLNGLCVTQFQTTGWFNVIPSRFFLQKMACLMLKSCVSCMFFFKVIWYLTIQQQKQQQPQQQRRQQQHQQHIVNRTIYTATILGMYT